MLVYLRTFRNSDIAVVTLLRFYFQGWSFGSVIDFNVCIVMVML